MSIQEKIYRYFEQYEDLHVLFMFDPNGVHRMELMGAEWPENYLYETYDKGSRGQVIDFFLHVHKGSDSVLLTYYSKQMSW